MSTTESRHDWVHRYCKHLMKLRPQMNAVIAVQRAVAAFEDAAEEDPILAAEMAARVQAADSGLPRKRP